MEESPHESFIYMNFYPFKSILQPIFIAYLFCSVARFKNASLQEYYRKHMCTTHNDFPVIMGDITEGDDSDGNGYD